MARTRCMHTGNGFNDDGVEYIYINDHYQHRHHNSPQQYSHNCVGHEHHESAHQQHHQYVCTHQYEDQHHQYHQHHELAKHHAD
mmetsp:Transcript_82024/g.229308  ORF Transcript_82024/g.229308 Transcript_82024/m.229308 type:complete len:84 (-) Transcript_82024:1101-1352(-)